MKNRIPLLLYSCLLLATVACNRTNDIEKGFAEVNGTRLYYEVAGSGDPLVLIHGNWGDLRHWDNQMEVIGPQTSYQVK